MLNSLFFEDGNKYFECVVVEEKGGKKKVGVVVS